MGFPATRPILRSLIVVVLYYFKNSIFLTETRKKLQHFRQADKWTFRA